MSTTSPDSASPAAVRSALEAIIPLGVAASVGSDPASRFRLGMRFGHRHQVFVAISPMGAPSLVVPLQRPAAASSRLTTGLALSSINAVDFEYGEHRWQQAAAVLECAPGAGLDAFCSLSADIIDRIARATGVVEWATVLRLFEEWERLLRHRRVLDGDEELGLWGELWFLHRSARCAELLEAWIGCEGAEEDFFLGGTGVEIKCSRTRGSHFVSQKQVDRPAGDHPSYLVSCWVTLDSSSGVALPELIRLIDTQLGSSALLARKLLSAGYATEDASAYRHRWILLEEPSWFDVETIPRVRVADPGITQIRYRVELDSSKALSPESRTEVIGQFGLPTGLLPHTPIIEED